MLKKNRDRALGVALLLCVCLAVAAAADQRGERPFKMTGHSQVVITFTDSCYPGSQYFPFGCPYEGHGDGVASHLGHITTTDIGVFPFGGGDIIAANGDHLSFLSNNAIGLMTISGGTGRFEGASGECTVVLTPDGDARFVGNTMVQDWTWTGEGTIAY